MRTVSSAGAPETSGSVVVLSLWQAPCHSMPSPLHHLLFQHGPFTTCVCVGRGRRHGGTGDRKPISTSWDPTSSVSQPTGPLWHLLPLTVPTEGDTFQERVWGFAMWLSGLCCLGKSRGVGAWCGGLSLLYTMGDPKSCSSLGFVLIFNC